MTVDETIDEALTALQGLAPVYSASGHERLDNHCPMMVEAMVILGRPDAVMPWVEQAVRDHPTAPPPSRPIGDAWREALGSSDRFGDWQMFFRGELAQHPWFDVVGTWVPRFLPGMASAGAHGVIRLAHGIRNLLGGETEVRIGEIADGLANWAAHYYELRGSPGRAGSLTPAEAIEYVELVPSAPGTTGTRFRDLERPEPGSVTWNASPRLTVRPTSSPSARTAMDSSTISWLPSQPRTLPACGSIPAHRPVSSTP